eukprot:TRINITY_DN12638_c0_g1_i1.p2 TRINITY_DN12638_c0_g1~~TRINITY_DN12638_c0_g1_i1.p2  ORF type:complete len:72 (+),score=5.98 TRINITY_DN12638_c0_g1_i1:35-250(+)
MRLRLETLYLFFKVLFLGKIIFRQEKGRKLHKSFRVQSLDRGEYIQNSQKFAQEGRHVSTHGLAKIVSIMG